MYSKFKDLQLAIAIREIFKKGYKKKDFIADLTAGFTISLLAIPMTLAVAIACGVDPEHGLYGAMIAAPITALLGGSRLSVAGPVAELAVLIFPVSFQYGFTGVMITTWIAGIILLVMGVGRLGRIIEFIPYPVTTGFIAGTGIVICALQFKDFFGLTPVNQSKYFIERMMNEWQALPTLNWGDTSVGIVTLLTLIGWPRLKTPIPSYLAAMIIGSVFGYFLPYFSPELHISTIGTRYAGIPQSLPHFMVDWSIFNLESIRALFASGFAIAMLCAIKALLCAVVLDGMVGTKHNPNAELVAHGIANLVLPFFGGLTSTNALSRSVANVRVGARSPISSVVHGLSILLVILIFAKAFSYLPMAGLAALLLMAAWNIFDIRHCLQIVRIGTRSDVAVLLICLSLTVLVDMVIAVGVGMVLAALLFMKKMAKITGGRWLLEVHKAGAHGKLPDGVMVYEISGPLFFGAAEKAMSTLREYSTGLKVVILHMQRVPTIDISGIVALKSALVSLFNNDIRVILADVQPQAMESLERAGVHSESNRLVICNHLDDSISLARSILKE